MPSSFTSSGARCPPSHGSTLRFSMPTRRCASSSATVGDEYKLTATSNGSPPRPRAMRRSRNCSINGAARSEEHTSELQSQSNLVCRLLLEKKKKQHEQYII